MKAKSTILTAVVGIVAVLALSAVNSVAACCEDSAPVSNFFQITSNPLLNLLFQILFWCFFLSPPLITLLLFLIWRELKARNEKMK